MKRLLLKCAALLLLDAGTGFFLLSLWRLATSAVFPAVLLNILFSLLAVNLLSLLSASIRKALHHISLLTLQTLTWIYYLFTMVFTGLTYLWVTPYSYCVIALIALLGYGLSLLAVYFIGRPHRVGVPAGEKAIAMEQMQKPCSIWKRPSAACSRCWNHENTIACAGPTSLCGKNFRFPLPSAAARVRWCRIWKSVFPTGSSVYSAMSLIRAHWERTASSERYPKCWISPNS